MYETHFNIFNTRRFADIYNEPQALISDFNDSGFSSVFADANTSLTNIYCLLYARYGNSHIANSDENQFKYLLFAVIWQYGPSWEKRLQIQEKLRGLSLDDNSDIYKGSKAIYNSALNPSTAVASDDENGGELPFVNSQNTTKYKKSKLDGLAYLNSLIETDVTKQFIERFKNLFIKVIKTDKPLLYETDLQGEE